MWLFFSHVEFARLFPALPPPGWKNVQANCSGANLEHHLRLCTPGYSPASALSSLGFTSTQWFSISIGNFASPISFQHLNRSGYRNICLDGFLRLAGFWRVSSKEEYQARLTCQHHFWILVFDWLVGFLSPWKHHSSCRPYLDSTVDRLLCFWVL